MLPVIIHRYTQALFHLASIHKVESDVSKDMARLVNLIKHHPKFRFFLKNPSIRIPDIQKIFQLIATVFQPITRHFLLLLAQKRRTNLLESIGKAFIKLYKQAQKKHLAYVTSATSLSKDSRAKLITLVKKFTNCKTVELVNKVNPKILGGYILHINGHRLDASVRTQLKQLLFLWTKETDNG